VISHKIMAMMHESARVQELELELMEIRMAFEDISSSQELKNGLDGGLGDMRTLQLDRSIDHFENDLTHIANIFCYYQIQSYGNQRTRMRI
jgi:hypothetical protein